MLRIIDSENSQQIRETRNLLSPVEEDTRQTLAPSIERLYAGARVSRLDSDLGEAGAINQSIYENLHILRQRSRQLAMDDAYAAKFFFLCVNETIGPKGLKLSVDGPDPKVNALIEELYEDWSSSVTTSCNMTNFQLEQLAIRTRHCDGEFFARIVENYKDNEYGIAVFPFDADRLELGFDTMPRPDGSYIRNSIEYNKWGKPVAYHVLERHPGDRTAYWPDGSYRMRIPADEIIHYFEPLRPGQGRGIPSLHAAIVNAKHLKEYTKATIVAARVIASKFAAITSKEADPYKTNLGKIKPETGEIINKVEAGRIFKLGPGEGLEVFDPKQPSGQFRPFTRTILEGYASCLGVTYPSLSGDQTATSFASGRLGALEASDYWSLKRTNFNSCLKLKLYKKWLLWAYLTQDRLAAAIKPSELNTYLKSVTVYDKPAVWIDPGVTSKVIETNLRTGVTTLTKELKKLNIDPEQHFNEIKEEKKTLKGIMPEDDNAKKNNQRGKQLEVVKA